MNCPKCNAQKLYSLQNNYKKCASCYYKFSYTKYITDYQILTHFCSNINALHSSNLLQLNYKTVSNKYSLFRKLIASYLQEKYHHTSDKNSAYEEFYYFTQRQQQYKQKSLYEAINIIGFYSHGFIYTLLMPPLVKSSLHEQDKNFEKYLSWHKIQSANAYKTPLNVFWAYLEQNLKKYKGINPNHFFYYLKECEFKYNFVLNKQIEILKQLYFI